MVGYNAWTTDRERPTALVVDVTARQRTLVERYVKDVVLKLDGVQADPSESAAILSETADALLTGGKVVTPQGSLDQRIEIPAARGASVRVKLEHERKLIHELLTCGDALLAGGPSSPTFDRDLQRLRVVGAELSSVTGDAAGEITKQAQHSLSRLVLVEIILGIASVLLALAMAWLLRRAAQRESGRFRSLVYNSTDLITVLDRRGVIRYQSPSSARLLEHADDDLVGTDLSDLVHADDRAAFDGTVASLLARPGEKAELKFRVRRRDGEWRTMEGVADEFARRSERARTRRELARRDGPGAGRHRVGDRAGPRAHRLEDQEPVPGLDEPRNSHTHERDHRAERLTDRH